MDRGAMGSGTTPGWRKGKRGASWQAKVRRSGQPMISKTFKLKKDAEDWATEVERDQRLGRFVSREAERRTLGDVIERYGREVLDAREGDSEDRRRQLAVWNERIGARPLHQVTRSLIADERRRLSRSGKAPATVNRYVAALSHALSTAANVWAWLDENPVSRLKALPEPPGRDRWLQDDERVRLLAACKESREERLHALVSVALCTGMRQGEILGLRWRDIDLHRGLAGGLDHGLATIHKTKNGEVRSVPLVGPGLILLRERSRVRRIDSDYVFVGRRSNGVPCFPRDAWVGAVAAAGLEDLRFHDLRHSAASYLAMNGATLIEISAVLGHKTMQMVKRYTHLHQDHLASVLGSMVNERMGGGAGAERAEA